MPTTPLQAELDVRRRSADRARGLDVTSATISELAR